MTTTIFDIQERNFTIIGVDAFSNGHIQYNGHVRFHGTHRGTVKMLPESKLVLERRGFIEGEINCHELEIHGHLEGSCQSSGRVIIYPGAKVSGTIRAELVVVHPGAHVNMEAHTSQTIN